MAPSLASDTHGWASLVCLPLERLARRVIEEFLAPGGKLLAAEYRGRKDAPAPWIDQAFAEAGIPVESVRRGFWQGKELTRVAVVPAG